MTYCVVLVAFLLSCFSFTSTDAYDPFDPYGNITIKTDVLSSTPDGYVAVVTIYNFQQHRRIEAPGWNLGWTWSEKEVIWSMVGGETMVSEKCVRFNSSNTPQSCTKHPRFVDLSPSTPQNQQIADCCKGGVLSAWGEDAANAVSSFQITVGAAGTTNRTVRMPKNYTFFAPGPGGYTCGPAKIVRQTKLITPDGRRLYRAMMTWNVTCTYSAFLGYKDSSGSIALAPAPDPATRSAPNLAPIAIVTGSLSPAPLPSSFSSCSPSFSRLSFFVVSVFLCSLQSVM